MSIGVCVCVCVSLTLKERRGSCEVRASEGRKREVERADD